MPNKIENAYKLSKNIYDDALTQKKWWAKLYNYVFWGGVDNLEISKKILSIIPKDFSGLLLDVPVGTAQFTVEKYAALPLSKIICLDYSEDMLVQAKSRFEKHHISNVQCIQGDVGNLPFENQVFDVLVSMNGFHAFPDKEKAFSETFRVLKKGGMFIGCFYVKGECKRTDFLVNNVLAPKGWFTPPFQTFSDFNRFLEQNYSTVHIDHEHSIAYFWCKK